MILMNVLYHGIWFTHIHALHVCACTLPNRARDELYPTRMRNTARSLSMHGSAAAYQQEYNVLLISVIRDDEAGFFGS